MSELPQKKNKKQIFQKIGIIILIIIFIYLIVKYFRLMIASDNALLNMTYTKEDCYYYYSQYSNIIEESIF